MPAIVPLDLARALAGEDPSSLSREPTRSLLEAVGAVVAFLASDRSWRGGNAAAAARLTGEAGRPCHVVLRALSAPCPDCPLTTGRPTEAGAAACLPVADGVMVVSLPYASGKFDARLAGILEHAVAAVFVADRSLRLLYANAAYARLHGRCRAGLLGTSIETLLSPEAYTRFLSNVRDVVAGRQPVEKEIRMVMDGQERWFLSALIPLFDENGEVEALCGMLNDVTDRRQAEQELNESRRRYLAIVEDQTELVVRLSPDLRRMFANRAVARLMGAAAVDLIGGSFLEYQADAEVEEVRRRLRALTPRAPVCDVRHRLVLPGSRERYLTWTVRAIFDESGRLSEYQATGRDITAYWRMERELIKSEAKYRDIFEHSAEGIFQFDPEGSMAACNPALARILGYASVEEVLSERGDLFRRIQARQEDRLEFLRQLAQKGRVLDFEMQVVRHDGRTTWLSLNARAVLDGNDRLLRVEGAARDINDRKRAEDERMLLVAAVDQSAEGLVIVSRDFRLEYANPAFAQIVGPAGGGEGGKERWLAPFLTPSVRKMLGLGLRWSGRVRLPRPDGAEGVVEALISPVRDAFGHVVNHVILVRDMTYETGLEKRLRQAEKLEAIGVLAGGVAHDFNNILTPILLNTEMILADIPWKDPPAQAPGRRGPGLGAGPGPGAPAPDLQPAGGTDGRAAAADAARQGDHQAGPGHGGPPGGHPATGVRAGFDRGGRSGPDAPGPDEPLPERRPGHAVGGRDGGGTDRRAGAASARRGLHRRRPAPGQAGSRALCPALGGGSGARHGPGCLRTDLRAVFHDQKARPGHGHGPGRGARHREKLRRGRAGDQRARQGEPVRHLPAPAPPAGSASPQLSGTSSSS